MKEWNKTTNKENEGASLRKIFLCFIQDQRKERDWQ